MGYTIYWSRPEIIEQSLFGSVVADCRLLLSRLPKHSMNAGGSYADAPLVIRGWDGAGQPELTSDVISFNGDNEEERYLGKGTMLLPRVFEPGESITPTRTEGERRYFLQSCRTGYRPYDLVVCATLLAASHHIPDLLVESGSPENWQHALAWYLACFPDRVAKPGPWSPDEQEAWAQERAGLRQEYTKRLQASAWSNQVTLPYAQILSALTETASRQSVLDWLWSAVQGPFSIPHPVARDLFAELLERLDARMLPVLLRDYDTFASWWDEGEKSVGEEHGSEQRPTGWVRTALEEVQRMRNDPALQRAGLERLQCRLQARIEGLARACDHQNPHHRLGEPLSEEQAHLALYQALMPKLPLVRFVGETGGQEPEDSGLVSNKQYDPTALVPKVTASCHSDDYAVEVESFDATPWFVDATDEQITLLCEEGYGGDYTADDVARDAAEYDEHVAELFTHLEIVNRKRTKNLCGFECYVNETEAEAWVAIHRPHLREQWEKEDDEKDEEKEE